MVEVGRRGVDGSPAGGAAFPGLRRAAYLREGSHNSHLTVLRQMLTLRSQPISNLGSLAMPASLPSTPLLAIPQSSFKFARRAKKAKIMPANPRKNILSGMHFLPPYGRRSGATPGERMSAVGETPPVRGLSKAFEDMAKSAITVFALSERSMREFAKMVIHRRISSYPENAACPCTGGVSPQASPYRLTYPIFFIISTSSIYFPVTYP